MGSSGLHSELCNHRQSNHSSLLDDLDSWLCDKLLIMYTDPSQLQVISKLIKHVKMSCDPAQPML